MIGYDPRPIETSRVSLPPEVFDLTEKLAENAHDVWAAQRIKDGWSYGPSRDDANKRHPCLVPYDQLPDSEKEYDRKTATQSLKAVIALGFRIVKASLPTSPLAGDGSWRSRLLASLRDCGVQRSPRSGTAYRFLASCLVIVLAAISLIGKELSKNLHTEGDRFFGWIIGIVWLLFCIFCLYRLRNWLWRQAWKGSAASAEDELERPDARRPILYLRSFQLDDRINKRTLSERFLGAYPSATAEQTLTKALRKTGPTIAIGRPDERLPALGAARFYVSHDRWQQKVQDVAAESQFVVWATGTTEGLRWEIAHLVATVPPEKVIVWAHPQLLHLSPREREAEWAKFRAALGDVFPMPLPERLGEAQFLYFTEGWVPHAVAPPKRPIPWIDATRAALRDVLAVKTGTKTASSVDYAGGGDDTFADLIGASGPAVVWPRVAGLFAALAAMRLLPSLVVDQYFSSDGVVWAALVTAATVAAVRFLRPGLAPLVAAAAIAILWGVFGWDAFSEKENLIGDVGQSFVETLGLLAGLSWSVRRMGPRPFALWFGAMGYPLASWLMQMFSENEMYRGSGMEALYLLLGPVAFSVVMELAVHLTPARPRGRT
jgi:ryanodine receptor 2